MISILVSLVIPLMDIQFRVSSLDRSLIVKDRRALRNSIMDRCWEEVSRNRKSGRSFITSRSIIYRIFSFPFYFLPFPQCARSKIIDKRNNETLAKARCNVRDQRMGSKPQLFSFYPDAFNSFVNLSPVPLSQRVVTLIQTSRFRSCTATCIYARAHLTEDYGQWMIRETKLSTSPPAPW